MARRFMLAVLSMAMAVTGAIAGSFEKIPANKTVALVSAIDPAMRGQKVGITAFNNKDWTAEIADFDVNAAVLAAVKTNLNREVKLVDGRERGLIVKPDTSMHLFAQTLPKETIARLAAMGAEWQVDYVLVIHATRTNDWIGGTNQPVEGFGHYSRHKDAAYGAFEVDLVDCATGRLAGDAVVKQAQMLPGVDMHDGWKSYSAEEQRILLRGLGAVVKDAVPALLTQPGLTDAKVTAPSLGSLLMHPGGPRPEPVVPAGNEIEIPAGVNRPAARVAIMNALLDREWVLQTDSGDRLVAIHRDGKKEAMCTFTFTDHSILLAPEGHEIQKDGKRVAVEVYRRWHNNLKESLVEELMKTPAETKP